MDGCHGVPLLSMMQAQHVGIDYGHSQCVYTPTRPVTGTGTGRCFITNPLGLCPAQALAEA